MIDYSISLRSAKPGVKKQNIRETKAYGVAQVSEVVSLNQFAKHISEHGSVYKRADILAILTMMVDCMKEMLLQGKKVQLGELGAFHVTLNTQGSMSASQFTVGNIKAVNVRWTKGSHFKNLIKEASFNLVPTRDAQAAAILEARSQEGIQLPGEIE